MRGLRLIILIVTCSRGPFYSRISHLVSDYNILFPSHIVSYTYHKIRHRLLYLVRSLRLLAAAPKAFVTCPLIATHTPAPIPQYPSLSSRRILNAELPCASPNSPPPIAPSVPGRLGRSVNHGGRSSILSSCTYSLCHKRLVRRLRPESKDLCSVTGLPPGRSYGL